MLLTSYIFVLTISRVSSRACYHPHSWKEKVREQNNLVSIVNQLYQRFQQLVQMVSGACSEVWNCGGDRVFYVTANTSLNLLEYTDE